MKAIKRTVKRRVTKPLGKKVHAWRGGLLDVTPSFARNRVERTIDYLEMAFVDHGIFRIIYGNRHEICDGVWRSSQPWPHQAKGFAGKGIRTIVNLRGGQHDRGGYRLMQEACRRQGVTLVDYKLKSRDAPSPQAVREFEAFFKDLEHPILIHCKSGADRVGFASVLYLYLVKGVPLEEAQKQLHARYGHFKHAGTGILDHFFDQYQDYARDTPISFYDWVDTVYEPGKLKASFNPNFWSNLLVDKILRRE